MPHRLCLHLLLLVLLLGIAAVGIAAVGIAAVGIAAVGIAAVASSSFAVAATMEAVASSFAAARTHFEAHFCMLICWLPLFIVIERLCSDGPAGSSYLEAVVQSRVTTAAVGRMRQSSSGRPNNACGCMHSPLR